jgi:hypothetical protein
MKTKVILAIMLLMGVAVSSASAQTIGGKARHERHRIAGGVRSGELSRPEAYRLTREQRNIHKDIRRAKMNDGHVGPRERKHIRHEQRKASRHIHRAKHNRHHRAI